MWREPHGAFCGRSIPACDGNIRSHIQASALRSRIGAAETPASWSSSPHASAPGLTAAALPTCYPVKLHLRQPRDKAIWATRGQE